MTDLCVVIATRGRPTLLARTLASLAECRQPPEYGGTIIVENGGRNGAEQVVREAPAALRARYMYEPQANKSAALNRVIASVESALLVFTDDDVRFAPAFLTEYSVSAASSDGSCFFGGPMRVDYERRPPEWLLAYLPASARGWELAAGTTVVEEPVFLGCNLAAHSKDLARCGGFPTDRGPGAESHSVGQDTAMQERLLAGGLTGRYVPDARVWHYVPRERSPPRWTLDRAYRHAVRAGLAFEDDSPRICRVPRWMFVRAAGLFWKSIFTTLTSGPESRFEAWRAYWKLRGLMRGCRLAYRSRGSSPVADSSPIPVGQ